MSRPSGDAPKAANTPPVSMLYNLVHSLTQAQKRDFKKNAHFWGGSESTKYLRLFDIVNRYVHAGKDKKGLLQHILKSKEFATKSAVSALADYLCTKILDSVRSTPEVSPRTNKLHTMLQDIHFLYNKGLHEECYAHIQNAMQLAREIDKSTYLLELYIWERRLLLAVRGVDEMAKRIQELIADEQQLVRNIQTFFALNTLNNELFLNLRQGVPLSETAQKQIHEFLHHDEQAYLAKLSVRSRYWYLNSLYYYFEIQHKRQRDDIPEKERFVHLQKALSYLDAIYSLAKNEGKILVKEESAFYNTFIDNYLNLCIRLGEFARIKEIEKTLVSERNAIQLLRSVAFHHIAQLLRANDFKTAANYIAKNNLEKRLRENANSIGESRLQAIRYTCGQVYFLLGDYNKASDWFAQILHAPSAKVNLNIVLASEFHHVISLFELGAFKKDPLRPLVNFQERLRNNHKSNEFIDRLFLALKCVFGKKMEELSTHTPVLAESIIKNTTLLTHFALVIAWLEARHNQTLVSQEIIKYNTR